MRKRFLGSICFIIFFSYLPLRSAAWGMLGHRIVGEIASLYLTPKARAEVQKILGNETIAMASNWGDFIKSDSAYDYLERWHYINFEKGLSFERMKAFLKTDTSVNAYRGISFLAKELRKKNLSKDKKLMYLRLLIHFASDVSQPLHVSPEGTTGGNDIKLTWFSTNSNLHRVWDTHLIEFQQLSYTEYVKAINFPSAKERAAWLKQPLEQWLYDSYTIAQDLHDEITAPNPRLGYEYNYKHVHLLNNQLLKGGIRLAGLLNRIFDNSSGKSL